MNESNFTKGSWHVAPQKAVYSITGEAGERLKSYNLPTDVVMVSVGTSNGQVAAIPMDESSMENAYLISAAPEMYRLLEQVNEFLISRGYEENYELRKVLLKARGKQL